jgi:ribosomal protein S18 acetylase RimI-like enzyme
MADGAPRDPKIRRLSPADLRACVDLTADRDWSAEENKWQLLFEVSEAYGIDDPAGGLAGMVVLTRYGAELAAIGMMVVRSRYGRMGLGTRLMTDALRRAGRAVVWLIATDYGRPLYARLGFEVVGPAFRYVGRFAPGAASGSAGPGLRPGRGAPPGQAVRPVSAADLSVILAFDRQAFGADRGRVLAALPGFAERFLVAETGAGQAVAGYGGCWRSDDTLIIGPVAATDLAVATTLISELAAGHAGPVRIDLEIGQAGLARWAAASGLADQTRMSVMALGGSLPGDRTRLFAPVTVATG